MLVIDPVVGTIVGGCFAVLFAMACVHKLRDLTAFSVTLGAYDLLPAPMVRPGSVLVALVELALSVALIVPVARWAADSVGAALLTVYGIAMAINLLRGRDVRCGCLGPDGEQRISPALVGRNALLALMLSALAWLPWSGRALTWLDFCTIIFAVAALTLLGTAGIRLAGQRLARDAGALRP